MAAAAVTRVAISGWTGCGFFQKARKALLGLEVLAPVRVEVIEHPNKDAFKAWWSVKQTTLGPRAAAHGSSPAVWLNDTDFLGGCDATLSWIQLNYMAGSNISKPPRVTHDSDLRVAEDGTGFDYDVVVLGGGSGGLAFSKAAAALGAKTCVLDFVKPSWQGTSWGLGGTCVNVGCIPKKLMHNASLLGEALHDAADFGWSVDAAATTHDWAKLVTGVQDHISSLNFGYRVSLREAGVEYKNMLGSFKDAHTIECVDKKGKRSTITARRVVIAVGGRPKPLGIPGGELAISSDDLFSMDHSPGKVLVIGASYVALECAGFLKGLGHDVTICVRSILLRGFDQQIAEKIGEDMAEKGVRFVRPAVPTSIEKLASGKMRVTWASNPDAAAASDAGAGAATTTESDEFDSVFTATGRSADTTSLNLSAAGVVTGKEGKIPTVGEQTNVPHVYAIGDVVVGVPELTPVAIASGRLLAARLYGGKTEGMDYDKVPTTVFTPLEYGCCGLSEEDAIARLGEEHVTVYHSSLTPLEWTVTSHRPPNKAYAKLIVHTADSDRVVGFHYLGPNAGEITQGWGAAMRLGATYESFSRTIGIHPTVAEEFTQLSITKASGVSADKAGC